MIWRILGVLALAVVAAGLYVRLAPSDPAQWHKPPYPKAAGDYLEDGGFEAIRTITDAPETTLHALDAIIMATPRTTRLAGSVADGMVTYVTRSAVWGFPDYTTVTLTDNSDGAVLSIMGRARFGKSDLGVNKARIDKWLSGMNLTKA